MSSSLPRCRECGAECYWGESDNGKGWQLWRHGRPHRCSVVFFPAEYARHLMSAAPYDTPVLMKIKTDLEAIIRFPEDKGQRRWAEHRLETIHILLEQRTQAQLELNLCPPSS